MKNSLIAFLIIVLIILLAMGCQQAPPQNAIYTQNGCVEICSVEVDSDYGSGAVKYVRVEVNMLNNTNQEIIISNDSFICAYGEAPIGVFEQLSFQNKTLSPYRSTYEVIYFKIPIDIENIQIQYTNSSGIGLFNYRV